MDAQLLQPLISSVNPDFNPDSKMSVNNPAEQITNINTPSEVPEWLKDNEILETPNNFSKELTNNQDGKNKGEIKTIINVGNLVEIPKTSLGEKEGLQPPLPGADSITTLSSTKEDDFITQVYSAHEPN